MDSHQPYPMCPYDAGSGGNCIPSQIGKNCFMVCLLIGETTLEETNLGLALCASATDVYHWITPPVHMLTDIFKESKRLILPDSS